MRLYLYRLMGAAMLDAGMYEGIEADRGTNGQAALTVLLSSLAAAFGAGAWAHARALPLIVVAAIAGLMWVAWVFMVFHIGTRMLPTAETRVTLGELFRTTGFAAAPGLLQVFAMFPGMAMPVFAGTWLWMLAAMVVAVQHALDYRTLGRALAVCGVALSLCIVLAFVLGVLWGPRVS
jgi:hypothetical protein